MPHESELLVRFDLTLMCQIRKFLFMTELLYSNIANDICLHVEISMKKKILRTMSNLNFKTMESIFCSSHGLILWMNFTIYGKNGIEDKGMNAGVGIGDFND